MEETPAAVTAPPPPAKEVEIIKPTIDEARMIANASVRSRAKSELRQVEDRGELRSRPAIVQEAVTYDDLASLAEKPNGTIHPTADLGGGEPIKVVTDISTGRKRAAKPGENDTFTITKINGKIVENGVTVFTCFTDGGAPVSIPVEVLLDAQLVGIARMEAAAGGKGILTVEQATVLDAYLETRYTGKNHAVEKMDVKVLTKAGEDSGLITTDTLRQFLDRQPEYKAEAGKSLTPAQETANNFRQKLLKRLESGTIASARDLADVIKYIYGPSQIKEAVRALRERASGLAKDMQFASKKSRSVYEKQLNDLVDQIQGLESAQSGLLSPGNQELEQFFVSIENGDFPAEVGKRISGSLRSGNVGDAVQAAIEAKIAALPKEDTRKKEWDEKMKNFGKNTLFAGGGLAALFLYFAIMGGKREQ